MYRRDREDGPEYRIFPSTLPQELIIVPVLQGLPGETHYRTRESDTRNWGPVREADAGHQIILRPVESAVPLKVEITYLDALGVPRKPRILEGTPI